MPDAPFDGQRAPRKPLPQCKAFLICEEAEVDDVTGQFNLYNLVNSLPFAKFPAAARLLVAFLQLYDGIGRYEVSVELRDLADESSVAAGIFGDLDFPERLAKMEVAVPIDSMRLPHPGRSTRRRHSRPRAAHLSAQLTTRASHGCMGVSVGR